MVGMAKKLISVLSFLQYRYELVDSKIDVLELESFARRPNLNPSLLFSDGMPQF